MRRHADGRYRDVASRPRFAGDSSARSREVCSTRGGVQTYRDNIARVLLLVLLLLRPLPRWCSAGVPFMFLHVIIIIIIIFFTLFAPVFFLSFSFLHFSFFGVCVAERRGEERGERREREEERRGWGVVSLGRRW